MDYKPRGGTFGRLRRHHQLFSMTLVSRSPQDDRGLEPRRQKKPQMERDIGRAIKPHNDPSAETPKLRQNMMYDSNLHAETMLKAPLLIESLVEAEESIRTFSGKWP